MFRSLNVAATGMVAQETKLDTIANNLANANTTGYKRQDAEFEDLLYQNVRAATPNAMAISAVVSRSLTVSAPGGADELEAARAHVLDFALRALGGPRRR